MTDSHSNTRLVPSSKCCEFTHWMESARPTLLRYTKRSMLRAVCADHDAEDVLHDALCITWEKREELGCLDGARRLHWTMRVIRNHVIDLVRQARARCDAPEVRRPLTSGEGAESGAAPCELSTSRSARLITQSEEAHRALASLQSLRREEHLCLMLRDFMRLEWSTVAFALGRSLDGAKGLRKRARERLLRVE